MTRTPKKTRAEARKRYAKLLRRWEASQYLWEVHGLHFAPATLAKFACWGTGPEICFVNKIPFYRPGGLDVWAKALISKPTPHAKKDTHHRNRSRPRQQRREERSDPPVASA